MRYIAALLVAAAVTIGLFYLMQSLISSGEGAMSEPLRHFIDRAQRVGHMPLDTQRLA